MTTKDNIEEVNQRLTALYGCITDDHDKSHFDWLVGRILTEISVSEIAMGGRT